jgi:hypothetical protein
VSVVALESLVADDSDAPLGSQLAMVATVPPVPPSLIDPALALALALVLLATVVIVAPAPVLPSSTPPHPNAKSPAHNVHLELSPQLRAMLTTLEH